MYGPAILAGLIVVAVAVFSALFRMVRRNGADAARLNRLEADIVDVKEDLRELFRALRVGPSPSERRDRNGG